MHLRTTQECSFATVYHSLYATVAYPRWLLTHARGTTGPVLALSRISRDENETPHQDCLRTLDRLVGGT